MFRSFRSQDQNRIDKSARLKKSSSIRRDATKISKLQRSLTEHDRDASLSSSSIVTLMVGREGRLFAAHEDVLRQSSFFDAVCRDNNFLGSGAGGQGRRISLTDEEPEIFSAVLEYLCKGDYYPRLLRNRARNSWHLEDCERTHQASSSTKTGRDRSGRGPRTAGPDATVFVDKVGGGQILRDTAVYCCADRYGLDELKRLALRKQGLQAGIDVGTILRSAQYAYAYTPDSDSRLRAHYLALIIRCRKTFKRSGTMQAEMEAGGSKLFFDLFVAMCNHLDDVIDVSNARTPRIV
ncbi:hypothetical protein E4U21_005652 [Claviceps maximensis]|nr:hypothetical protein E4U21_005652 [Claviceps maximensis]